MATEHAYGEPYIGLRNGRYYIFWYDADERRTRRKSLKTSIKHVAEERAATAFAPTTVPVETAQRPARRDASTPGPKPDLDDWTLISRRLYKRSQENARQKSRPHSVSAKFIADLMAKQDYLCAVTGFPFSRAATPRNPFAPSLDQIKAGEGYTPDNVRVVLVLVNHAMSHWGEAPFLEVVRFCRITPTGKKAVRFAAAGVELDEMMD